MRMVIICKNDVAFKYSLTKILLEYEVAVAVNVVAGGGRGWGQKEEDLGIWRPLSRFQDGLLPCPLNVNFPCHQLISKNKYKYSIKNFSGSKFIWNCVRERERIRYNMWEKSTNVLQRHWRTSFEYLLETWKFGGEGRKYCKVLMKICVSAVQLG